MSHIAVLWVCYWAISPFLRGDITDVIICANFGDDPLRGLVIAGSNFVIPNWLASSSLQSFLVLACEYVTDARICLIPLKAGVYIGWSEVTVIYGHNITSMLWGNTAYCVKLSGEA